MQVEQRLWHGSETQQCSLDTATLTMAFGSAAQLDTCYEPLRRAYPQSHMIGCSTAGKIAGGKVFDATLVSTAVRFDKTALRAVELPIADATDSFALGQKVTAALRGPELTHIFVLCDGIVINGSQLVAGMVESLPAGVGITGGLAGDGDRFVKTHLITNQGVRQHVVAAVGFYGKSIRVGYGSMGGWDAYGPQRRVTKSRGNILTDLDGRNALSIYKEYLGEYARELPSSALLFPLSIDLGDGKIVVRTILGIDESAQTMRFAGDVPEGAMVRFMRANFDRLIEGAMGAAQNAKAIGGADPSLAILISCVGRRLVLKQRVEEELEGVAAILGAKTSLTGFYSYGEIAPLSASSVCAFHNQTMTVTTFRED